MASADCRAERGCAKCTRFVTANRSRVIISRWMSNSSPSRINAARKSAVFNIRLSTTRRAFGRSKSTTSIRKRTPLISSITSSRNFRSASKKSEPTMGMSSKPSSIGMSKDKGIRHAYIKKGTPQLNGKVERSHRSDQEEFYQLLSYKDDIDLETKLEEWENFYNFNRPHGAFNGKTPYEALREKCSTSPARRR